MPRNPRVKVCGESAYYHVVTRSIHKQYLMGDVEKEKLTSLIKKYSDLYLVKLIGYAIMSNHIHLLIKVDTDLSFSDEEIQDRVENFYGKSLFKLGKTVTEYRGKLSDISEYVKQVKQAFSFWYNKLNNQTGTFWSERFKSILVETGTSLLTVLSYIDLNPLRAGIVKQPEAYRHSSIGYRYQTGNKDKKLTFEGIGLLTDNNVNEKEQLNYYKKLLYSYGNIGGNNETTSTVQLTSRIRYMTDGVVIGTKSFIMKAYTLFGGKVIFKKERKAHKTGISPGIYSIRKLRN